jgi:hypothetical protein
MNLLYRIQKHSQMLTFLLLNALGVSILHATPPCILVNQAFASIADGATSDPSATGWSMSTVSGATYWACQSHRIKAQGLGAVGTWSSAVFNISGRPNVQVEVKVSSEGTLDTATEYVAIYYKLNGGALTLMQKFKGNFGTPDIFSVPLNGSTVQIVIQVYNKHNGLNSYYYIENYGVNSQVAGCALTVTPSVSNTITCAVPSATLSSGANTTSNVTYSWTGPSSFTSTLQNPVVTTAGTYNVTASIAASSSTATGSIVVSQNTTTPGATASESGTLTCTTTSVPLSGSSTTSGVTYAWAGPNSYTSTLQNPSVSATGTYTLTTTNPTNGCKSTSSTIVPQNITAPGATAGVSGPLTCANTSVTLSGGSGTSGVAYSWSGSNGLKSTLQNPTVTAVGVDTVTVTNPTNGCKSTAAVTVAQNKTAPGATPGVSGILTCSITSVTLSGSSATSGVTYSWTGPNSFTSTAQNASVSIPGSYTLTVTNPVNGCTSTATITVTQNITVPGATANETGTLTCTAASATLSGSSSTSGVTYSWTGPGSYTSTTQNPVVNTSGTYILTVRNPTNGCSSTASTVVPINTSVPGAIATGGTLTCSSTSVALSGSSSTSGITYKWAGPNSYSSSIQNPTVNNSGSYTLTVTDPTNGCTSTATATVAQNNAAPGATAGVVGTLSCATTSAALTGNSSTSGVTYGWAGPSSFVSAIQNPVVSTPGIYTLTVTNPVNGCTSTAPVTVFQNTTAPDISAIGGSLPCSGNIAITGNSTTTGATFGWTGPGGFTSTSQSPVIGTTGVYTLTVTNPANGCSASDTAIVVQGIAIPGVTATVSGVLTCSTTSVSLSGNAGISGVIYNWSGPGSFTSASQNSSTSIPGTYTLTVSNPNNGCTSTTSAVVAQNLTTPGATASVTSPITCTISSVTLMGSSGTSGVSYGWTGPNGYTSSLQSPSASALGTYTLTVTNQVNGCISSSPITLIQDITSPGATAGLSGTLTCSATSVSLSGSSATTGVTYEWTGPNSFTSTSKNPVVSTIGTYTLTVTNPVNGCSSLASTIVTQNVIAPTASAIVGGTLTCSLTSVILAGSSNTTGVNYSWSGPSSFSSTLPNPAVNNPGTYTLTVTDPSNGCSSTTTASVAQNITPPGATAAGGTLTCSSTSIALTGSSNTSGVTYSWAGPNSFTSTLQNPVVSAVGSYVLTTINPINSCSSISTTTVIQNINAPGATATGGTLTCTRASLVLAGSSSTSGVIYSWTGPSGFTSSQQNPSVSAVGTYTLTVTYPVNGCSSTTTTSVTLDTIAPGATANVSGPLGCTNPSVALSGNSGTSGVTYAWTGPGSFTSTSQNPLVSDPGSYTLVTSNSTNGCTSTSTVLVVQNSVAPGITVGGGGTITCTTPSVMLSGSSNTSGVTYNWSGPNSFTSTLQNPTVTAGGTYTLIVTNPVNGCTSTGTVVVNQNTVVPGVLASGGILTCTTTSVSLAGSSTTSGVGYNWSGPGSFTSTLQNPTVNTIGTFTLIVTNPVNGCTATATASVSQNITAPGATATGGSLTCTATSVTIAGSSGTSGVTYSWTGPNGFTSSLQNPNVSTLGTYTLTVTNPANGCTSIAAASVTQNTTIPGIAASGGGTLTCTNTSVALSGTSGTSGVTYSWTGPNGYTSALQNPSVSTAGIYNLTITNPINNCIATGMINVLQNVQKPGVKASSNGTITCATTSVSLTASSAMPNTTFSWGGFTEGVNPVSTSYAGKYFVTATNPVNGCTSVDSTVVSKIASSTSYQFVYNNFSAYANGVVSDNSTTNGWYLDNSGVPGVSSTYTSNLTPYFAIHSHRVSAQQMGGQGIWYTQIMNVAGKPNFQLGVKITSEGTLNSDEYVKLYYKLDGGSEVLWAQKTGYFGTLDFRSPVINANTVQIVVKLYNYGKGGSVVSNYYIEEEQLYIGGCGGTLLVYPAVSGNITCANPSATLSATASHSGATFQWTGPNGFTSTQQYPVISTAGTYNVTATIAPSSTATGSVIVTQNKTVPGASASVADTLTCAKTFATLLGSSSTSGVTYSWTGPNNFASSMQNPIVTSPGIYTLTVTNPANGCTSTASVNVVQNSTITGASATVTDSLTCSRTSVTITGNFTTSGVIFGWTGPNGFTSTLQNPSVSAPGLYTLTVTNPVTGCVSSANVNVIQSSVPPNVTAIGGKITCTASSVVLTGSSSTSGVTYNWSGPGFTSTKQNPTVSTAGIYTLTVTNPINGCTATDTGMVSQNLTVPGANGIGGLLTCAKTSVKLTGSSATSGVTYSWIGPGLSSSTQNPTVSMAGTFTLTVTNPVNGCTSTDTAIVSQNATLPIANGIGGLLTCARTSVALTGSSPTSGVTYSWSGPSFTSSAQNPTVSAAGTYTLTVTNPVNGCVSTDTAMVTQNNTVPGANGIGAKLTCTRTSVTLTGSSSSSGVTYGWTGPGFTSSVQNPTVSAAGTYTLTVTNPANGCVSTDTAIVSQNTTVPGANGIGGIMTCTRTSVTLTGSSSTSGVTYSWAGPGFTSSVQNPTVSAAGTYTLTVTNPVNGCISTDTAIVSQNTTVPVANGTGGSLTCTRTSVVITGSSSTLGVIYSWSGSGFTSSVQNPTVSTAGTYTLTVTNPVNGCVSTDTAMVSQNTTAPGANGIGAKLTCSRTSVTLTGNSSTSGVTYSWSGPSITSSAQNPTVSTAGTYTLTVTNPVNGCVSTDTAMVTQNITAPGANGIGGITTCTRTSVTLTGSSSTSGVAYSWAGPGFASSVQNPTVSAAGTYTLTVTNPVNGCISTDTAMVSQNTTVPGANGIGGIMSCTKTSVTLTGSSSTSGVTYSWAGPGFTSSVQNPTVSSAGTYTLTVTNPVNGCASTDTAIVSQNTTVPAANGIGGSLTCTRTSVALTGSSSTLGVTYSWSGPGFTSSLQNPIVSTAGTYTLTVTNPVNGCMSTDTAMVTQNSTVPGANGIGGLLTCTRTSVSLSGNSFASGVTYSWSGPGFTSSVQNPTVNTAGTYTLTVTNPINGCVSTDTAVVSQNTILPGATAGVSGSLNCTLTSVTLFGNSGTSGVNFSWSGPLVFASTEQNPVTAHGGTYAVVVTNPINGCTSSAVINVLQDTTRAVAVTASVSGKLTCGVNSVTLTGSSSTSGVTYNWNGPNGFTSSSQSLAVTNPGNYILFVGKSSNGCIISTTATVLLDTIKPKGVVASPSGIISCTVSTVVLTGSSTTSNVSYNWSGPGIQSTAAVVNTTNPGVYSLTVTNQDNNCSIVTSATVVKDLNPPAGVTATAPDIITCASPSVILSVTSSTPGIVCLWTGPGNYLSNENAPHVSKPGTYSVVVTDPYNNCSVNRSVDATQNITVPEGVLASASDILSCFNPTVSLNGYSSSSGVTYGWSGPQGYTSGLQNPIVNAAGTYILTVTSSVSGCTTIAPVLVEQDSTPPMNVLASVSGAINCLNSSVVLTGTSSTTNADYEWYAPNGNFITSNPSLSVVTTGNYTLVVTNSNNGCSKAAIATVVSDKTAPISSIITPASSPVALTNNALSAQVVNNATYLWMLSSANVNWLMVSGASTQALTYQAGDAGTNGTISLRVTNNGNGCSSLSQVILTAASSLKSAKLTTTMDEEVKDVVQNLEVKAYPNPFRDRACIEFTPVQNSHITIDLYNSNGILVKVLFDGEVQDSQSYKAVVDGTVLSSGTYHFLIRTSNQRKLYTNQLILIK